MIGQAQRHARACSGSRFYRERTADGLRTLTHHDQPQTTRTFRFEPVAIVADFQAKAVAVDRLQAHPHFARTRVPQRIGQAFLRNTEAGLFDLVARPLVQGLDIQLQPHLRGAEQH